MQSSKTNLFCNSQHSFLKFKDICDFKELSLDSMYKKLNDFHKKFMFKKLNPQTKGKEDLKEKVKNNAGDLFNELHQVYQDIYNQEKKWLKYKKQKEI